VQDYSEKIMGQGQIWSLVDPCAEFPSH
jgi:hypothetical protein